MKNLVVGIALVFAVAGGTPAAAAEEVAGETPPGAAVVTPMLGVFQYGAGSGLPLLCSVSGGVALSAADQVPDGGRTAGPVVSQLNDGCTVMSTSGKDFFGQAIEQSRALAPINPVVNPALAAMSDTMIRTGTDDAALLAPFGPTVAGTGGLLAFLQGR